MEKTQLWKWHEEHGARMVDFAGWYLPVQFTSIIEEHMAVREKVGMFDVSHMGRYRIKGKHAQKVVEILVPRNIAAMPNNKCGYTFYLNERGGFRDDTIVGKINEEDFWIVCNASNREKIINWAENITRIVEDLTGEPLEFKDYTMETAMFAVQGPLAPKVLEKLGVPDTGRWLIVEKEIDGVKCLFTGTGYTGEIGFEVSVFDTTVDNPENAIKIWEKIIKAGEELGLRLCGLGARDSLRLEAGLPLYGDEIEEDINPIEAGLDLKFFLNLEKEPYFFGRAAIERIKKQGVKRKRIGFKLLEKGIPRHNYPILNTDGKEIGFVTSGVYSPLNDCGIGMGYIDVQYTEPGTKILIQIRKKQVPAEVVPIPFYDTEKYGWKRKS